MTKKQALSAIELQKSKINTYYNDFTWISVTLAYFEEFWGKDSHEYKILKSFDGSHNYENRLSDKEKEEYRKKTIDRLYNLLEEAIAIVNLKGINQPPKRNFLSKLSDSWLIAISTIVIPGLFTVGFKVGQYYEQNKKSTITVSPLPNANPIPNVKADSHK
jgi:hypothetical protein